MIVTVFDEEGKKLAEFDGPDRGAERFQFETKKAGVYKIKVAAFEKEAGDFKSFQLDQQASSWLELKAL